MFRIAIVALSAALLVGSAGAQQDSDNSSADRISPAEDSDGVVETEQAAAPPEEVPARAPATSGGGHGRCQDRCDACGGCASCACTGSHWFDDCCQPLWTVNAGAVFLERSRPSSSPILQSITTGQPLLTGGNFGFNFAAGPDVQLIRRLRNGKGLEIRYFAVDGGNSNEAGTIPPNTLLSTIPKLTVAPGTAWDAPYRSQLYSAEINLRRASPRFDWLTWLAGFRWVELQEGLDLRLARGVDHGDISSRTNNHLYGGQIGANMNLWDNGGPFRVNCWAKSGLFGNLASNNFALVQPGMQINVADHASQAAFVGDIAANASYQLTDHVAIRAGYQLLWIQGVAIASDQIVATDMLTNNGINTTGGAFYHGALTSINFTW